MVRKKGKTKTPPKTDQIGLKFNTQTEGLGHFATTFPPKKGDKSHWARNLGSTSHISTTARSSARFACSKWAAAKCHGIQVQLWACHTLDLPPFHYLDILARRAPKRKRNGQNGLSQATPVTKILEPLKFESQQRLQKSSFLDEVVAASNPYNSILDCVGFAVSDGVATAVSVT